MEVCLYDGVYRDHFSTSQETWLSCLSLAYRNPDMSLLFFFCFFSLLSSIFFLLSTHAYDNPSPLSLHMNTHICMHVYIYAITCYLSFSSLSPPSLLLLFSPFFLCLHLLLLLRLPLLFFSLSHLSSSLSSLLFFSFFCCLLGIRVCELSMVFIASV